MNRHLPMFGRLSPSSTRRPERRGFGLDVVAAAFAPLRSLSLLPRVGKCRTAALRERLDSNRLGNLRWHRACRVGARGTHGVTSRDGREGGGTDAEWPLRAVPRSGDGEGRQDNAGQPTWLQMTLSHAVYQNHTGRLDRTRIGDHRVWKLTQSLGERAEIIGLHPRALRHATRSNCSGERRTCALSKSIYAMPTSARRRSLRDCCPRSFRSSRSSTPDP
jgi:hypothetical protein